MKTNRIHRVNRLRILSTYQARYKHRVDKGLDVIGWVELIDSIRNCSEDEIMLFTLNVQTNKSICLVFCDFVNHIVLGSLDFNTSEELPDRIEQEDIR